MRDNIKYPNLVYIIIIRNKAITYYGSKMLYTTIMFEEL